MSKVLVVFHDKNALDDVVLWGMVTEERFKEFSQKLHSTKSMIDMTVGHMDLEYEDGSELAQWIRYVKIDLASSVALKSFAELLGIKVEDSFVNYMIDAVIQDYDLAQQHAEPKVDYSDDPWDMWSATNPNIGPLKKLDLLDIDDVELAEDEPIIQPPPTNVIHFKVVGFSDSSPSGDNLPF